MADTLNTRLKNAISGPYRSLLSYVPPIIQGKIEFADKCAESLIRNHRLPSILDAGIETNTKCNYAGCSYCPTARYDRGDHYMSPTLYNSIIDQLKQMDFKGTISPVGYGESLVRGDLETLMEYTRKQLTDARIVIYTNGIELTVGRFDSLVDSGVDYFVITQHTPQTQAEVERLLQDSERKRRIFFRQGIKDTPLSNRGGLVTVKKQAIPNPCYMAPFGITILYDGNVVLCCNDYFGNYSFGNVGEENLKDIWNKPEFKRIRRQVLFGIFEEEICKKCVGKE